MSEGAAALGEHEALAQASSIENRGQPPGASAAGTTRLSDPFRQDCPPSAQTIATIAGIARVPHRSLIGLESNGTSAPNRHLLSTLIPGEQVSAHRSSHTANERFNRLHCSLCHRAASTSFTGADEERTNEARRKPRQSLDKYGAHQSST